MKYIITDKHRKNLSKALTGRKLSTIHKQNISKYLSTLSGEKSRNWKGGVSSGLNTRDSTKSRLWRFQVLERDNYTCQVCNQYGGQLHADHIEPFSTNLDLRYELNNGRTLCRACHYYITFKRKLPKGSKWGIVNKKYKECI